MKARGCRRSALIVSKRSRRVFEEWKQNRLVKSCALEPGGLFTARDFEEGVQNLDTAFTDMSPCSGNCWLSRFVQEVSNSSRERYPSRSLDSIIWGLKRHLPDVNGSAPLNPFMSDRR